MTSGQIVTATFDLGNSSAVRKRVTAILHDADFSDLAACTFWMEAGQPLSNYTIRAFATEAWANATLSVYPATVGADEWIRLDNVTLRRTPSAAVGGTDCVEPSESGIAPAPQTRRAPAISPATTLQAGAEGSAIDLRTATAAHLRLHLHGWAPTTSARAEVQVSLDAGKTWITIAQLQGPEDLLSVDIDLLPFLGEVILVRFVLYDAWKGLGPA